MRPQWVDVCCLMETITVFNVYSLPPKRFRYGDKYCRPSKVLYTILHRKCKMCHFLQIYCNIAVYGNHDPVSSGLIAKGCKIHPQDSFHKANWSTLVSNYDNWNNVWRQVMALLMEFTDWNTPGPTVLCELAGTFYLIPSPQSAAKERTKVPGLPWSCLSISSAGREYAHATCWVLWTSGDQPTFRKPRNVYKSAEPSVLSPFTSRAKATVRKV